MPLCQLQFCTNRRTHRPNETLLNFKEPYNTFHSLHVLLSLSQSKIVMLMAHCGQRPFVALFWEVAFKTGTFLFKSILPFWNSPKCMVGMGVLDQRLDLRILQVFFNLNDSMVLQLYDHWAPASTCPVLFPWTCTREQFSPPGLLHNWKLPTVMGKITLPSSALLHTHLSPHSSWIATIVGRLEPSANMGLCWAKPISLVPSMARVGKDFQGTVNLARKTRRGKKYT